MVKKQIIADLQQKALQLRKEVILLIKEMGVGWLGGSFSSAEIVTALYYYRMKHDPKNPLWEARDRLIMSKGHSCEIIYAALADLGYFPKEELKTYSHLGARLQTHVDCRAPGIDCSGGSLGLGLSFAVGSAMGAYISADQKNLSAVQRIFEPRFRVYCIVGDGECNEGQVWEAVQNANHFRLDNLTVFIDHNKFQSTGAVENKMETLSLAEKFRAFGWETREIDGHRFDEVVDTLDWVLTVSGKPQAVIANTAKGKGFPCFEGTNCHFVSLNDELVEEGFEALK